MTDRQKKGLIFNPETGISEDGTMHDGVYRQWINQPKKEQKMTREEAMFIQLVDREYGTKFYVNINHIVEISKYNITLDTPFPNGEYWIAITEDSYDKLLKFIEVE